ncbi:MAG: IS5 family transposase [Gammaproteobacteria bacterium]|nr:IS5 family transposase [Gammaproteobacteria bacterium]
MNVRRYYSDLTDKEWSAIQPLIPPAKAGGRPRTTDMREVVNALKYMLRTGCQWSYLPKEFPPKSTVYEYYSQWRDDGSLEDMTRILREKVRVNAGRNDQPSAAIVDSQTVKNAGPAEDTGYDGGKKTKGRKRHIAVDILGLLLCVVVHSGGIQDRAGAKLLLVRMMPKFPGIQLMWADGGYTGDTFKDWVMHWFGVIWKVVKHPRKVFKIVKFRWIVERTFGWMNHERRLSKDYEYLAKSSEAWVQLAAINMMVRRLG